MQMLINNVPSQVTHEDYENIYSEHSFISLF